MTTPHKHAEVIKAWADGKTIQYSCDGINWVDYTWEKNGSPAWYKHHYYRIKPEDIVYYRGAKGKGFTSNWVSIEDMKHFEPNCDSYIKIVYDGVTGQLKSIKILKD